MVKILDASLYMIREKTSPTNGIEPTHPTLHHTLHPTQSTINPGNPPESTLLPITPTSQMKLK